MAGGACGMRAAVCDLLAAVVAGCFSLVLGLDLDILGC
jgi:hypothetical protein